MTDEPKKETIVVITRHSRRMFLAGFLTATIMGASWAGAYYTMKKWQNLYTLATACSFSDSCSVDANLKIYQAKKKMPRKARGGS